MRKIKVREMIQTDWLVRQNSAAPEVPVVVRPGRGEFTRHEIESWDRAEGIVPRIIFPKDAACYV
jgi:hypothetical protein